MSEKVMFLSLGITPEARKEAFIHEYPEYANHPWWDEDGMPSPDPKELASYIRDDFGLGTPLESLL